MPWRPSRRLKCDPLPVRELLLRRTTPSAARLLGAGLGDDHTLRLPRGPTMTAMPQRNRTCEQRGPAGVLRAPDLRQIVAPRRVTYRIASGLNRSDKSVAFTASP